MQVTAFLISESTLKTNYTHQKKLQKNLNKCEIFLCYLH